MVVVLCGHRHGWEGFLLGKGAEQIPGCWADLRGGLGCLSVWCLLLQQPLFLPMGFQGAVGELFGVTSVCVKAGCCDGASQRPVCPEGVVGMGEEERGV